VAIKDNYAVAGVPMMFGSRVIEGYVPDFDATAVTRILDAGRYFSSILT
jgi:amidase